MDDRNVTKEYYEFIERLEFKFKEFIYEAKDGLDNRHSALAARKASISIREDFKDFRILSVDNDKYNVDRRREARENKGNKKNKNK